jgi:hypothetical protein
MKRLARILCGGIFGAALVAIGVTVSPRNAQAAAGGFCDETQHYLCCCSTDSNNNITHCECVTVRT